MTIKELMVSIPVKNLNGDVDRDVTAIHFDSRKVVPGSVFVAVRGKVTDGHKFIDIAIDRGAICVIAEEMQDVQHEDVSMILVEDSASSLAIIASAFYGHPSRDLVMVGV